MYSFSIDITLMFWFLFTQTQQQQQQKLKKKPIWFLNLSARPYHCPLLMLRRGCFLFDLFYLPVLLHLLLSFHPAK